MNHTRPGFNDGVTETVWLEDSSQYYRRCISLAKCTAQGIGKMTLFLQQIHLWKRKMEREKTSYIKRDHWKPLSASSNIDLIWKINSEIRYSQRNPSIPWTIDSIRNNRSRSFGMTVRAAKAGGWCKEPHPYPQFLCSRVDVLKVTRWCLPGKREAMTETLVFPGLGQGYCTFADPCGKCGRFSFIIFSNGGHCLYRK